jgi:hypothetical protein
MLYNPADALQLCEDIHLHRHLHTFTHIYSYVSIENFTYNLHFCLQASRMLHNPEDALQFCEVNLQAAQMAKSFASIENASRFVVYFILFYFICFMFIFISPSLPVHFFPIHHFVFYFVF